MSASLTLSDVALRNEVRAVVRALGLAFPLTTTDADKVIRAVIGKRNVRARIAARRQAMAEDHEAGRSNK